MRNFQDIHIADAQLQLQFIELWGQGNFQQALDILETPQLDLKKFTHEVLYIVTFLLTKLENDYFSDFVRELETLLNVLDNNIKNFVYKGVYSATVLYKVGNIVIDDNGEAYLCIEDSEGFDVQNTRYWAYVGLKGKVGNYGVLGLKVEYDWNAETTYQAKTLLSHNDKLWISLKENTGEEPSNEQPNSWVEINNFPKAEIEVTNYAPSDSYEGMIWIKPI